MMDRASDLQTTMRGIETGLRVEHIATFALEACSPDDEAGSVLDHPSSSAFDQFPVRDDDRIVGVLERPALRDARTVRDRMRPLADGMLVSAGDSLGTLLPLMAAMRYQIVVQHAKVAGLVTRSDLLKLPVRLYAFTMVTHLELLMTDLIDEDFAGTDGWMACLGPSRQAKVIEKLGRIGAARLDPPPLEFTEFCDKRDILRKHRGLKDGFEKDLKEVEELRNSIAHAADYAGTVDDLKTFIARLALVEKWTTRLTSDAVERRAS